MERWFAGNFAVHSGNPPDIFKKLCFRHVAGNSNLCVLFCMTANLHFLVVLHPILSRPCPVRGVVYIDCHCSSCNHIAYHSSGSYWHFHSFIHEKWWWNLEGQYGKVLLVTAGFFVKGGNKFSTAGGYHLVNASQGIIGAWWSREEWKPNMAELKSALFDKRKCSWKPGSGNGFSTWYYLLDVFT